MDNLSGDLSQDYFADGLTDELITMLARDSELRIVSRTSAMQYKHARRLLRDVARELGADAILEGSLERANGRVHMTIQLVRARKDSHIWAESFDRDQDESVSLAAEVAQAVAKRLGRALPPIAATPSVLPGAHDAYLHGRYLWFTGLNEEGGAYFKRAVKLQPG